MRLYVEVARRSFARVATYRQATIAGVFTNTVFGFLLAYVLLAVYRERDSVGGLRRDRRGDLHVRRPRTADDAGHLRRVGSRRANHVRRHRRWTSNARTTTSSGGWPSATGRRATTRCSAASRRSSPERSCSTCVSPRPGDALAFTASVVVAVALTFAWSYLLQLTAFWLLDVRGPVQLGWLVAHFLRRRLRARSCSSRTGSRRRPGCLPFASMVQVPVEIWLGKHHGLDLLAVVAVQLAWTAALGLAGRAVMGRAERRVVVQGG